jgi:hypothetical protein
MVSGSSKGFRVQHVKVVMSESGEEDGRRFERERHASRVHRGQFRDKASLICLSKVRQIALGRNELASPIYGPSKCGLRGSCGSM